MSILRTGENTYSKTVVGKEPAQKREPDTFSEVMFSV